MRTLLALGALFLAIGCGAGDEQPTPGAQGDAGTGGGSPDGDPEDAADAGPDADESTVVCDPGSTIECECGAREIGLQTCLPDGSGYADECEDCSPDVPEFVQIEIREAVVMPGPNPNEAWDGLTPPPPEAWDAVILAASGTPVPGGGEVVNAVLEFGIQGVDLPDIFGETRLWTGAYSTIPLETVDNDLHAIWDYVGWTDVELTTDTFVDVTLFDEDLTDDDTIGSVSLRYDVLVEAWVAGGGYWYEGYPALDDSGNTIVGVKFAVLTVE